VVARVTVVVLLLSACGGQATPAPAPDALVATCTDAGIELDQDAVEAQVDGVHLTVENAASRPVVVQVTGGGYGLVPETRDVVRALAPGTNELACAGHDGDVIGERVEFEVVDPRSLYVPVDLQCEGGPMAMPDGSGTEPMASALDAATAAFADLRSGMVRRGGYPEQEGTPWVLVRSGRVVAKATIEVRSGGDRFAAHLDSYCVSAGSG
jgi:hypothetical protein